MSQHIQHRPWHRELQRSRCKHACTCSFFEDCVCVSDLLSKQMCRHCPCFPDCDSLVLWCAHMLMRRQTGLNTKHTLSATCKSARSWLERSALRMMSRHRRILCTLLFECSKDRNWKKRGTSPNLHKKPTASSTCSSCQQICAHGSPCSLLFESAHTGPCSNMA